MTVYYKQSPESLLRQQIAAQKANATSYLPRRDGVVSDRIRRRREEWEPKDGEALTFELPASMGGR